MQDRPPAEPRSRETGLHDFNQPGLPPDCTALPLRIDPYGAASHGCRLGEIDDLTGDPCRYLLPLSWPNVLPTRAKEAAPTSCCPGARSGTSPRSSPAGRAQGDGDASGRDRAVLTDDNRPEGMSRQRPHGQPGVGNAPPALEWECGAPWTSGGGGDPGIGRHGGCPSDASSGSAGELPEHHLAR
jgi:hypothetical protein